MQVEHGVTGLAAQQPATENEQPAHDASCNSEQIWGYGVQFVYSSYHSFSFTFLYVQENEY